MTIYRLSEQLYIAPQLQAETLDAIKQLGIQTLICNRPDGEADDQTPFAEIAQQLQNSSIQNFVYLPATMPEINAQLAEQFAQATQNQPVLAYCRTGTRSSLLWAIHQATQGVPTDELIALVLEKTGIDLSVQRSKIDAAQQA